MSALKQDIEKALMGVLDPATGKNLVEAGRVKRIDATDSHWAIDVEITNPALHVKKKIEGDIAKALSGIKPEEAVLQVHFMVNAQARAEERKVLPGVKRIIAVASGKGGVGKSTVAVNLAAALSRLGSRVGILDADIYGPSVPLMLDTKYVRPGLVQDEQGRSLIEPIENYGIKMLSIGFFAGDDQAVAWRGPMASKALTQMITEAAWGELDFLILDLPPGTGDIHLSLVQLLPLSGVIVVSTPQEVALADARKGVAMFQMPNIQVPVLGLVENMAWFSPLELPENKYFIFGEGGAARLAQELKVPLLAQIPLVQGIRESGDRGLPAALDDSNPASFYFRDLAVSVMELSHRLPNR
jgi:ATP-binding protein involved in chromosome partitioning